MSDEYLEKIGKRLRKARQAKGLTQQQVAAKADISLSYYELLERGQKNPSVKIIRKLIDVLGLDIDSLLKK